MVSFEYVTAGVALLWASAHILFYQGKSRKKAGIVLHSLGTVLIGGFILSLWSYLERPPLRTLGETRIWYAFFLGGIGMALFIIYRYKWLLSYASLMGLLFLLLICLHPETWNKTLMPALQNPWFVPHVVVYLFAYAVLGMATLAALWGIYLTFKKKETRSCRLIATQLIGTGYCFLTLGLLFGALWAKTAWGHYWTWDPKETWAFISWMAYLIYMHYQFKKKEQKDIYAFQMIVAAFVLLLVCCFGVNYLPTSAMSVHTYSK